MNQEMPPNVNIRKKEKRKKKREYIRIWCVWQSKFTTYKYQDRQHNPISTFTISVWLTIRIYIVKHRESVAAASTINRNLSRSKFWERIYNGSANSSSRQAPPAIWYKLVSWIKLTIPQSIKHSFRSSKHSAPKIHFVTSIFQNISAMDLQQHNGNAELYR
jgi:hypothetical protein